jgi:hypothetical protein
LQEPENGVFPTMRHYDDLRFIFSLILKKDEFHGKFLFIYKSKMNSFDTSAELTAIWESHLSKHKYFYFLEHSTDTHYINNKFYDNWGMV